MTEDTTPQPETDEERQARERKKDQEMWKWFCHRMTVMQRGTEHYYDVVLGRDKKSRGGR